MNINNWGKCPLTKDRKGANVRQLNDGYYPRGAALATWDQWQLLPNFCIR